MRRKLVLTGVLALAAGAVAAGFAVTASDDDDEPLAGPTLERATAAALADTGGGTVVETEAGDDGAAYEVEVRLDDGSVVEVSLDESFRVIGREADDDEGAGDDED